MTVNDFMASLTEAQPPTQCPILVQALWYDAKDNWEKAHEIAQSREGTREYDRLHAYLHRKEGDQWNAGIGTDAPVPKCRPTRWSGNGKN